MSHSKFSSLARNSAIAVLLLCASFAVAQQQARLEGAPPASSAVTRPTAAAPNRDLLIGPGDLLEVSVYGAPDFDKREVRVDSDGSVTLPLIDKVKVGGLSTPAAEELIAKKLSDGGYFLEPKVSVFTKDYASQGISVLGEVQKPGIYPLLGERNLLDVISAAGGTTPRAGNMVTITHRAHPREPEQVNLSFSSQDAVKNNVVVYPGDTVLVSKAGIVYVVGDVHLPSGIVIDKSDLTIVQAIALAQGTNPTASLKDLKLVRTTANGRQESSINLKKILEAKAPDVRLQPDDILYVPSSKVKVITHRGLEAIVQTASGVAVYRPY
ncbi:MAG: polysaccharide biosynthesis/export family protein [Acidobacteria bacterium]|nr:polysaccharide biosynthesis/export family protein [Acidobacteriota bacterium]MBV9436331.1 polysaccharide biosynthesis/export family protein [Acidobacteriota bacterium]